MSQVPVYYQDDEVQVDGEVAAFPEVSFYIADIIKVEMLVSETQYLGMDRDYVLPVLGGAATLLYIMAKAAPEPGYYAVVFVLWAAVSVWGFRARKWYKDKRQMYTYTVALHTADRRVEAYSSTDKHTVRMIISAIDRAIESRRKQLLPERALVPHQAEAAKKEHAPGRPGRQHPAWRPEALPKLKKRH